MRVAVLGAGVGGLATAAGLQRAGAEVTVLERAPSPGPVGSGLSLFGNGFAALDALGLGDDVRALGRPGGPAPVAGQRRPDGRWLTRLPAAAIAELQVVHRADLHRVLLDALQPGTVRYGARAAGVSVAGTEVQVDTGSGTPGVERFDLVVAADGIRSGVRAGWPGDPGVRYAGYAAWRGVTSGPVDLRGEAGETWGRGLRFGIAPLGDGRVYWFAVATLPAGSALGDGHARVTRTFAGWHRPIAEVVAATPPSAVTGLDVHELAGPVPTFRRGRCVLLGDAAHAMTPDLGQGANQALEDAATLVRLVAGPAPDDRPDAPDLDAALDAYDRLRRPRTQRIARQARLLGAVAQARGPVSSRLRDTVLRLVPGGVAARRSLRLQSWRPPAAVAAGARRSAR